MTWLGIVVYVVLGLVLWPLLVNRGVRHGHRRTWGSDRFAGGTAGLIAASPIAPFLLPVTGALVIALAALASAAFWLYVTH